MSLAGLYNLNSKDPASLLRWSFNNASEHFKIQQAIFDKHHLVLPLFPIDPIPMFALDDWARRHQTMHSGPSQVLKLQDFDLSSIDFNKPEQVTVWVMLHAQAHMAFAAALELT